MTRSCRGYFEELAAAVEGPFRASHYSYRKFPDLAAGALAQLDCARFPDLSDVYRYALTEHGEHQEGRPVFGDLPLILHHAPHFRIQVIYWTDATTAIHQHSFSGAFAVIAGSSIHSQYHFDAFEEMGTHLRIGATRRDQLEVLKSGDIRKIHSGVGLTHSLYHLADPSVSIVIRTHHEPWAAPQMSILPPDLAVDPRAFETEGDYFVRALRVHLGSEGSDPAKFLRESLGRLPPGVLALKIYDLVKLGQQFGFEEEIFPMLAARYGANYAACLRRARAHVELVESTATIRAAVKDPRAREFFGIMANATTRQDVLAIIQELHPEQSPHAALAGYLETLIQSECLGFRVNANNLEEYLEEILAGRDGNLELERRLKSAPALKPLWRL